MMALIIVTGKHGGGWGIISKFNTNTTPGWQLSVRGSGYKGLYFRVGAADGLPDVTPTNDISSTLSNLNWHPVTMTRNSGNVTLYLDGIKVGSGVANKNVSSTYGQYIGVSQSRYHFANCRGNRRKGILRKEFRNRNYNVKDNILTDYRW